MTRILTHSGTMYARIAGKVFWAVKGNSCHGAYQRANGRLTRRGVA